MVVGISNLAILSGCLMPIWSASVFVLAVPLAAVTSYNYLSRLPMLFLEIASELIKCNKIDKTTTTRTTRTPAFWGYPPPPHYYPYHWVILDPKSKEDKVKVTNLKNFETTIITRDTSSEFAWKDVQIRNGSDEYFWRYRADTILSTDGQTDRRRDE